MPSDAEFMARALALAERGRGFVTPNPRVGAVLVRDGVIVAEGWHKVFGGPHAEVECLRAAERDHVAVDGATMYVTLEPCNHFGKTPPCSRMLLEAGLSRVVIGCLDPNPVAGGGAALLRQGGVTVTVGVLEQECRDAIRDFTVWKTMGRPHVTVKLAMTLDGRIATRTGDAAWVSGEASRDKVHALRASVSAVMIGGATLSTDNPQLTHRLKDGPLAHNPQPLAIVVTRHLPDPDGPTTLVRERPQQCIFLTDAASAASPAAIKLTKAGIRVWPLPEGADGTLDLHPGLQRLRTEAGVYTILCEGGGGLAGSLLAQALLDELLLFYAPKILGDAQGVPAVSGLITPRMADAAALRIRSVSRCGDDIVVTARPVREAPAGGAGK